MFDHPALSQVPRQAVADWRDALRHGDVVSFRFPVEGDGATPKTRPCLVLDIEPHGARRHALLAYGTTSGSKANRGCEVAVIRPDLIAAAGLRRPTRFVGARRILVPLQHSAFAVSGETGSPVLGRLEGPALERLNRVRARIHAEADIAAERRDARRREWAAWRTEAAPTQQPHPFTVERRSLPPRDSAGR